MDVQWIPLVGMFSIFSLLAFCRHTPFFSRYTHRLWKLKGEQDAWSQTKLVFFRSRRLQSCFRYAATTQLTFSPLAARSLATRFITDVASFWKGVFQHLLSERNFSVSGELVGWQGRWLLLRNVLRSCLFWSWNTKPNWGWLRSSVFVDFYNPTQLCFSMGDWILEPLFSFTLPFFVWKDDLDGHTTDSIFSFFRFHCWLVRCVFFYFLRCQWGKLWGFCPCWGCCFL